MCLRVYSNVNSVSYVTLPISLTSKVLSSDWFSTYSFLNYKPLCNLTLAVTLEAIIGYERIFAKLFVSSTGFTLSTLPPVISARALKESKLHSSPMIEITLIVSPLFFANSPTCS